MQLFKTKNITLYSCKHIETHLHRDTALTCLVISLCIDDERRNYPCSSVH